MQHVTHAQRKVLANGSVVYYARYLGPDGKIKTESGPNGAFKKQRDAERFADKREQEVRDESWMSQGMREQSFKTYVEKYFLPVMKKLEATTVVTYLIYLESQFYPRFGDMPMWMIQPSTVQAWVNDFSETHEAKTTRNYHSFLHKVFARAVIDKAKASNPCTNSELPKVIKKKKRIITPEEFALLIDKITVSMHLLLVNIAIETGARWGECMGLRPCDFDFATNIVTVNQTIVELKATAVLPKGCTRLMHPDDKPSRYGVKPYPKDDEVREISLEPETVKMVQTYMMANGIRDDARFFTTSRGLPLSRNTFRTRVWLPATKSAKLPKGTTFHHLRAAHASWLLDGGASLQVVKERLGHVHISTTEQYLGTLPGAGQQALDAFSKIRNRTQVT